MSQGELLQIEKARRLDIQESIYFEIMRQKQHHLFLQHVRQEALLRARVLRFVNSSESLESTWA